MVEYSNFPSDQKIYGSDVLEYFVILACVQTNP